MKNVAAVVFAFAAIKSSFAQTLTLPTCGATCMVSSVSVTSCSASDLECLCTNSNYINVAVHCIARSCDSTDAQNAYEYATYACSTVGVTVPSVSSVLAEPLPGAPAPPPPAQAPPPAAKSATGGTTTTQDNANTSPATAAAVTNTAGPPSSIPSRNSSRSKVGVIVGATIGGVAAISVAAIIALLFYRLKKPKRVARPDSSPIGSETQIFHDIKEDASNGNPAPQFTEVGREPETEEGGLRSFNAEKLGTARDS